MSDATQYEEEMLRSFMRTDGWSILKKLFQERATYLVKESHLELEKHNDRKAGELLARSKEPQFLINKVVNRKRDLKKENEDADK